MKKVILIFALSALFLTSFNSCKNEEENLFDQTSALRLEAAKKDYTELLTSAENGWAMEYFATEKHKGYLMLVKFKKDGSIKIAANDDLTNNKYTEEEGSLYELIADNGPVLTFNTATNLLHRFSAPEDIPNTKEDEQGTGYGGDYEFIMVSPVSEKDHIMMKGKKRGFYIRLSRLSPEKDWKDYFSQTTNLQNLLSYSKIPNFWLSSSNGEKYALYNFANGILNIVPEKGDSVTDGTKLSVAISANGIRLIKPFTGNSEAFSVQSFIFVENNSALICTDDNTSRIFAPSGRDMFCDPNTWSNGSKWNILPNEMGGKFKSLYATISQKSLSTFKYEFDYYFNINSKGSQSFSFGRKGITTGTKNITMTYDNGNSDQVHFTIQDKIDAGWNNLVRYIPEIENFVNMLSAEAFKVQSIIPMKPSTIKLINIADENDFLTVSIE